MRPAPLSKAGAILRVLAVLVASLGMTNTFCNQEDIDPSNGDLDRLTDVVLVTPDDSGLTPHSYAIVANPEIEQLRVYDTFDRTFVRAPNLYFPLAVQVGPATRRISGVRGAPRRVLALDGADDTLRILRTVDEGDRLAFTLVGDGVDTRRAPGDVAGRAEDDGVITALVTVPDEGVVSVLRIAPDGTGDEVAVLDLGAGARPTRVVIDPSTAAAVVTDTARDMVAVLSLDPPAIDRFIDVGGPTLSVATGRIDPGDGLAPVALVSARDRHEVCAIRLLRPENREDRAALLGCTALPAQPLVGYVPDQGIPEINTPSTVCCPGLRSSEGTLAWAAVITATGDLIYLRLDGARSGALEGQYGLVRVVDDNPAVPGFVADPNAAENRDQVWFPGENSEDGEDTQPRVRLDVIDNYGQPPSVPYRPLGVTIDMVWEGELQGLSGRTGSFSPGLITLDGVGDLTARDVRPGDVVVLNFSDRDSPRCPPSGVAETEIELVQATSFSIPPLDADLSACLTGGDIIVSVRAKDAFVVDSDLGPLGRLRLGDDDETAPETRTEIPGFRFWVQAATAGAPARNSQLIFQLTDNVTPLMLPLSQNLDVTSLTGFGQGALLAGGVAGGEMFLPDSSTIGRPVRRMFIATGTRQMLELNETETDLSFVVSPAN